MDYPTSTSATDPKALYTSGLVQRKKNNTYYGYNTATKEGIAFPDEASFKNYFGSFDPNAATPEFDTTALDKTPNVLTSLKTPEPVATPVKKNERETLQPFIDAYVNSMATDKVAAAKKAYLDSVSARDVATASKEGQGRGIVTGIIRGQQERIAKMAAPELARLQGDVGVATDEANTEIAKNKARLDYESALYTNEANKAKEDAALATTQQEKGLTLAQTNGVKTPYFFSGGTGYRTSDLHAYGSEAEMLKDLGTKTIDEAKAKGLISDLTTPSAAPKLEGSATGGYYSWNPTTKKYELAIPGSKGASGGGSSGGGGTVSSNTTNTGLNSKQLARVKQIIAANPGEYGHAADQIDKELFAGAATKADNLLKSAYLVPADAREVGLAWDQLSEDQQTLANYNSIKAAFLQDHAYSNDAITQLNKYLKKPKA